MTWATDWWRFALIIPFGAIYIWVLYRITKKKRKKEHT